MKIKIKLLGDCWNEILESPPIDEGVEFEFYGDNLKGLIVELHRVFPNFESLVLKDTEIMSNIRVFMEKEDIDEELKIESKIIDESTIVFSKFDTPYRKKVLEKAIIGAGGNVVFPLNAVHEVKEYIKKLKLGNKPEDVVISDEPDVDKKRFLHAPVVNAIKKKIPNFYLFQEEMIKKALEYSAYDKKEALLATIGTGRGKTEAFLIPVLEYILRKKMIDGEKNGPYAIIFYPTKALADDQANRILNYLYELNQQGEFSSDPYKHISMGLWTADTPYNWNSLSKEYFNTFIEKCPRCKHHKVSKPAEEKGLKFLCCNRCGEPFYFVRFTKDCIRTSIPDIIITNPDSLYWIMLRYDDTQSMFLNKDLKFIVFDEMHLYYSIFGANTAHLLRRFEKLLKYKPIYFGLSASINNVTDVAEKLFDIDKNDFRIGDNLFDEDNYTTTETEKVKVHLMFEPIEIEGKHIKTVTATVDTASRFAHTINENHARKTLIFTNFRTDTDEIIDALYDEERRFHTGELKEWLDFVKNEKIPIYHNKVRSIYHRGGLSKITRLKNIKEFILTKPIPSLNLYPTDIMVSTKTLEVGIDIGDVTTTILASSPISRNEYMQRVGRAGRKADSLALIILNPDIPLDYYYRDNFEKDLVNGDPEDVPIAITNEFIVRDSILSFFVSFITSLPFLTNKVLLRYYSIQDFKDNFSELIEDETKFKSMFIDYFKPQDFVSWLQRETDNISIDKVNKEIDTLISDFINKIKTEMDLQYLKDFFIKRLNLPNKFRDMSSSIKIYSDYFEKMNESDEVGTYTENSIKAFDLVPCGTNKVPRGLLKIGPRKFQTWKADHDRKKQREVFKILSSDIIREEILSSKFVRGIEEIEEKILCPKSINVKPFPSIAFCEKCGIIYGKKRKIPIDFICINCNANVRQLPEVWICDFGHISEIDAPDRCFCGSEFFEHMGYYKWNCKKCGKKNDRYKIPPTCDICKNKVRALKIPKIRAKDYNFNLFNVNNVIAGKLRPSIYNKKGLNISFGECKLLFLATDYECRTHNISRSFPILNEENEPVILADTLTTEGIKINISDALNKDFGDNWSIFVHSLKHALINAAPKYTGVTRHEFIGIFKPDKNEIIIADSDEGGNGASRLFYTHFEKIWNLASEIVKKTKKIELEINCQVWNEGLDINLVRKYFEIYTNETKSM